VWSPKQFRTNNSLRYNADLCYSKRMEKITLELNEIESAGYLKLGGEAWLRRKCRNAAPRAPRERPTESCRVFLIGALSHTPMSAREMQDRAETLGLSLRTLGRVKRRLGIRSYRKGGFGSDGVWYWSLPDAGV
jgi:hypothetical protein